MGIQLLEFKNLLPLNCKVGKKLKQNTLWTTADFFILNRLREKQTFLHSQKNYYLDAMLRKFTLRGPLSEASLIFAQISA